MNLPATLFLAWYIRWYDCACYEDYDNARRVKDVQHSSLTLLYINNIYCLRPANPRPRRHFRTRSRVDMGSLVCGWVLNNKGTFHITHYKARTLCIQSTNKRGGKARHVSLGTALSLSLWYNCTILKVHSRPRARLKKTISK